MTDGASGARSARRRNIVGAWVAMACAAGVFVANVTWERPFVERVCEPRPDPLPELCTTVRELSDDQWRSSVVIALIMLWAVSGTVAWRSWRQGQLARTGAPAAFTQRRFRTLLAFRRRIVMQTPGFLAAISFALRKGSGEQITETIGPVCSSVAGAVETCRTSTVVVKQTVTTASGTSVWPQVVVWMLVVATLAWWIYVVAAENLARRFGEEHLWHDALQMRRAAVPQHPASQQRGDRY